MSIKLLKSVPLSSLQLTAEYVSSNRPVSCVIKNIKQQVSVFYVRALYSAAEDKFYRSQLNALIKL